MSSRGEGQEDSSDPTKLPAIVPGPDRLIEDKDAVELQTTIGPQGLQGLQGIQGPPGPPGLSGADGLSGGTGATGPHGEPGGEGPRGLMGTPGGSGPPGSNGSRGTRGASGASGPPGSMGPPGVAGLPGTVESPDLVAALKANTEAVKANTKVHKASRWINALMIAGIVLGMIGVIFSVVAFSLVEVRLKQPVTSWAKNRTSQSTHTLTEQLE